MILNISPKWKEMQNIEEHHRLTRGFFSVGVGDWFFDSISGSHAFGTRGFNAFHGWAHTYTMHYQRFRFQCMSIYL